MTSDRLIKTRDFFPDFGEMSVDGTENVESMEPYQNSINAEKNQVREDVVTISISGITYELDVDDIRRAPSSRLHKYVSNGKTDFI